MKRLTILLFSILISFNSHSEWVEVAEAISGGRTFYVDADSIIENSGYVYYWKLSSSNSSSPEDLLGGLYGSAKIYSEVDCGIKRERYLAYNLYTEPMGKGKSDDASDDNPKWKYPAPGTIGKIGLDFACKHPK